MPRCTNARNRISIFGYIGLNEYFFYCFVEFDFCNKSENASSVIHFLTNQMQIKLNSMTKKRFSIGQVPR